MATLMSTAEMNTVPSTVTAPSVTASTLAACKSSKSKAKLLFNSDGSVKLLGDPSFIPGSGIDGNSHTLVPTVGPDGKMTMLLTPAHGQGKTFILSPTNGASLPSPKAILTTSADSGPITPNVQTVAQPVNQIRRNSWGGNTLSQNSVPVGTGSKRPVVLTSDEHKRVVLPPQKSLLSGMKDSSSSSSSDFVTHMRIDPSGSSISTVRVPTSQTPSFSLSQDNTNVPNASKNMYGSTVLRNIAEKVKPNKNNKKPMSSPLTGMCEDPGVRIITVNPEHNVSMDSTTIRDSSKSDLGDHKYAVVSSNRWTKMCNVLSTYPSSIVFPKSNAKGHKDHPYTRKLQAHCASKTDVSKNFMMTPSTTQQDGLNTSGTYTVVFAPLAAQTNKQMVHNASSTVVSSSTFGNNYVIAPSNKTSSTTLSTSTFVNTSKMVVSSHTSTASLPPGETRPVKLVLPGKNTNPSQFRIKDGQITTVKNMTSISQNGNPVTESSQKLIVRMPAMMPLKRSITDDSGSEGFETRIVVPNAVGGRLVPFDELVSDKSTKETNDDKVLDSKLDPVTGHPVTDNRATLNTEEEEDTLSIKIDSVFSLSTKDTERKPSDGIVVDEDMDSEVHVKTEKNTDDDPIPMEDEPRTVICHPSYVVLEQMSKNQIENPKKCIFKCSDYCRARTLNFLCSLGLLECKPTVHTINPVKKKQDSGLSCDNKLRVGIKGKKRKEYGGDKESSCSVNVKYIKQEAKTDSVSAPCKFDSAESTANRAKDQNASTVTASTVQSSKVKKVASPGRTTKVIKFTKVEKNQINVKTSPKTSPLTSVTSQKNTDIGVLSSICPITRSSLPATTQVSPSVSKTSPPIPVRGEATKVIQGQSLMQVANNLKSILPLPTDTSQNRQYFLFNLNGQKILIPTSNDLHKPTAFVLKGNTYPKTNTTVSSASIPVTVVPNTVSSVIKPTTPLAHTSAMTSKQRQPQESTSESKKALKIEKTTPAKEGTLPGGIRIKTEPVTHGYGDEKPPKLPKQKKSTSVKVKQEPIDNEWQEIWSSASRPVADPDAAPSKKRDASNKAGGDEEASMPELPMMKVPSRKEIAQKTAAQNDRIEKLKAMLREKEKLIQDLKMKRLEEAPVCEEIKTDKLCELTSYANNDIQCEPAPVTDDLSSEALKKESDKSTPKKTEFMDVEELQ